MARIVDRTRRLLPPKSARVVAYLLALIGAPVVVAVLGFWALLIPIFAVFFGGIPYLVLAGPVFWLALQNIKPRALTFALIGSVLNLLTPVFFIFHSFVLNAPLGWESIQVLWAYGAVFSALWGAVFALLYRALSYLLVVPVSTEAGNS
ncbi:MAG: hypothetical protein AB3N23_01385 [Paracoccaceae bacterium]